jgi:hypothetical protein
MSQQPSFEPFCPVMKAVKQPQLTVVMEGYIRLQIPASASVQGLFDFAAAAVKATPEKLGYVVQEADEMGQQAVSIITDMLSRSPGIHAPNGNIGVSYAVIDGKLQYIYQLGVHTK